MPFLYAPYSQISNISLPQPLTNQPSHSPMPINVCVVLPWATALSIQNRYPETLSIGRISSLSRPPLRDSSTTQATCHVSPAMNWTWPFSPSASWCYGSLLCPHYLHTWPYVWVEAKHCSNSGDDETPGVLLIQLTWAFLYSCLVPDVPTTI